MSGGSAGFCTADFSCPPPLQVPAQPPDNCPAALQVSARPLDSCSAAPHVSARPWTVVNPLCRFLHSRFTVVRRLCGFLHGPWTVVNRLCRFLHSRFSVAILLCRFLHGPPIVAGRAREGLPRQSSPGKSPDTFPDSPPKRNHRHDAADPLPERVHGFLSPEMDLGPFPDVSARRAKCPPDRTRGRRSSPLHCLTSRR